MRPVPKVAKPPPPQNKILAALPGKEYDRLSAHLTPVSLNSGETLYEMEGRIKHVYFVNRAVVSLVTHMEEGTSVEVGLVGNEGMVGLSIVMGDDVSPNHAIVQIADGAMRMTTGELRKELKRGGQLQNLLLRYSLTLLKQVSQTAACNRNHNLGERLARWLLLCQDRVGGDELRLTQEFLAQMLGTRRSRVSEAAIILQHAELIRYSRGIITILDREGLEEFACECYRVVKAEFDRLFGSQQKTR
jgi:CRP-like cAMP-binding protein